MELQIRSLLGNDNCCRTHKHLLLGVAFFLHLIPNEAGNEYFGVTIKMEKI
jgi:hypothetical protein